MPCLRQPAVSQDPRLSDCSKTARQTHVLGAQYASWLREQTRAAFKTPAHFEKMPVATCSELVWEMSWTKLSKLFSLPQTMTAGCTFRDQIVRLPPVCRSIFCSMTTTIRLEAAGSEKQSNHDPAQQWDTLFLSRYIIGILLLSDHDCGCMAVHHADYLLMVLKAKTRL